MDAGRDVAGRGELQEENQDIYLFMENPTEKLRRSFFKKEEQMSGKKGGGKLPAGMSVGEAATLWMEEKRGMERIYLCNLSFYNRKTYSAAIREAAGYSTG